MDGALQSVSNAGVMVACPFDRRLEPHSVLVDCGEHVHVAVVYSLTLGQAGVNPLLQRERTPGGLGLVDAGRRAVGHDHLTIDDDSVDGLTVLSEHEAGHQAVLVDQHMSVDVEDDDVSGHSRADRAERLAERSGASAQTHLPEVA